MEDIRCLQVLVFRGEHHCNSADNFMVQEMASSGFVCLSRKHFSATKTKPEMRTGVVERREEFEIEKASNKMPN